MKKFISLFLVAVFAFSIFGCGKKEGDLGEQTTVDEQSGYTLFKEARPFEFKKEEDALEERENLRKEGFKYTQENAKGATANSDAVLAIALEEVTVKFNAVTTYYDRTRGIWKVVFSDMTETEVDGKLTQTHVTKETIYIDRNEGYTLFAYTE